MAAQPLGFTLPELRRPSDRELTDALLRLVPNLIAYALSFGVIGIMWQNHHALFRLVDRVDRMTVFLNLVLLGGTAFIPFATSTLGTYPTMHASTFLYGLALTTLRALWLPIVSFGAYLAIAIYHLVPRGVDADIDGVRT